MDIPIDPERRYAMEACEICGTMVRCTVLERWSDGTPKKLYWAPHFAWHHELERKFRKLYALLAVALILIAALAFMNVFR